MTLKYESEILYDLMKRDGDDTPSDVLPYESELKEKYLQQVEGDYPKLQDYRPEWLNYNLNAHLPADFPVESVSNVTNATFENVVPYAYGSAILKGQTLVNLTRRYYPDDNNIFHTGFTFTSGKSSSNRTMRMESVSTLNPMSFKPNTKYLIQIEISELNLDGETSIDLSVNESSSNAMFTGTTKFNITSNGVYRIITTTRDTADNACVVFKGTSEQWEQHTTTNRTMTISHVMYLEYQEGMENWDIPYFTGMQSVKMPVLKTVGKNLFDKTKLSGGEFATFNGKSVYSYIDGGVNFKYNSKFKENTQYTFTGKIYRDDENNSMKVNFNFYYTDGTRTFNNVEQGSLFTLTSEKDKTIDYISGSYNFNRVAYLDLEVAQLEESSVATSYEPYKSNILTVNEEVELRGNGEVQDELNLLTGELTQRIGEVVLDGIENANKYIVAAGELTNTARFRYRVSELGFPNAICKCDKMISQVGYSLDYEHVYINENDIWFFIEKTKLTANAARAVQEYLTSNPITVQYQLATEKSIKTVDLTVTDQDGNSESIIRPIEGTMHLMTEGDTIKPLFSGEIPVEATTQNLMSFANILEEE